MDTPSSVHLLFSEISTLEGIDRGSKTSYICTLGSVCTLMDLLEYLIQENRCLKQDIAALRAKVYGGGSNDSMVVE